FVAAAGGRLGEQMLADDFQGDFAAIVLVKGPKNFAHSPFANFLPNDVGADEEIGGAAVDNLAQLVSREPFALDESLHLFLRAAGNAVQFLLEGSDFFGRVKTAIAK